MSKSEWGNITWILFHSLIENIKEETPNKFVNEILTNIKLICNNLPCPYCRDHAVSYLNKYKNYNFNTKEKLKIFIYTFHNTVNVKLKKKSANIEILDKYKKVNLNKILISFKYIYLKKQQSKMLMYSFHRRIAVNKFLSFISSNKEKFNNL
tara:strand:- start:235 stop:690 length:456 start_codon:yes stop_codon:yes gene_type:complete